MPSLFRLFLASVIGVGLCAWVAAQAPSDPQLQQAQEQLQELGFDPGETNGIMGQRTRDALKEFQREHNLTETGTLDMPTLQALGLDMPSAQPPGSNEEESRGPKLSPSLALARIVIDYLRFYESQPARLLPHVTDHFRGGSSPQEWVDYTLSTIETHSYTRLSWEVQHVEVDDDTHATVQVRSHVRVDGQESAQQEIFSLGRSGTEDPWKIDAWESHEVEESKDGKDNKGKKAKES